MKIRYTKKRLNHYLIFGFIWIIVGITAVLLNSENLFNYGYLIIGLLYFGSYIFENNKHYLMIENGIIIKNILFPKKIRLNDIQRIEKLGEYYILSTGSTEMKINTELIEKRSLAELNMVLDSLYLETD